MNTDTIGIPKIWAQYMNNKDCSQALCSFYCPQWCYAIFPPPPPPPPIPPLEDFGQSSSSNFSPLVITIIGFLAGALLLVSYYAIISKYCSKRSTSTADDHDRNNVAEELDNGGADRAQPSNHEPWFVASNGLDEALIKSIAMFNYKRGDGLVEGTDCSVCLSEFVEDEMLRLLPKCTHAFHVQCIDTWLKRHSNCPLCRANVAGAVPPLPPSPMDSITVGEPMQQSHREVGGSHVGEENVEREDIRDHEFGEINANASKTVVELRPRRSLSMDSIYGKTYVLYVRVAPDAAMKMKRSHSTSGRCFFPKYANAPDSVIPF